MRFHWVQKSKTPRYSGYHHYGHKWGLPGIHCPTCNKIWATTAVDYPCVDLTSLDEPKLKKAYCEDDYNEFVRLVELVRPFVGKDALLRPGAGFGPVNGRATGKFGPIYVGFQWEMLVNPETLESFRAAGLRGLRACRTELRFARKDTPQLLEMHVEPYGQLHPDCIPPRPGPPCVTCGARGGFKIPDEPVLELASLPTDRDIFRLANATTMIIVTQPFVDTVRRLELPDIEFQELPAR